MWFQLYCFRIDIFFPRWTSTYSFLLQGCGKVLFSSVCLFTGREVPCDHYLWYIGSRCTRPRPPIHDLTPFVQDPDPPLVISGGQDWTHVQTSSLEDPLPGADICGYWKSTYSQAKVTVRILLECFLCSDCNKSKCTIKNSLRIHVLCTHGVMAC